MTDNISILDMFDALHPGESWRPWRVFVKAVHGHPLDDDELTVFQHHTGREAPREGGYPEAALIVGVQSGKTAVARTMAVHAALTGSPGTYALAVAQDFRGALRTLLRYAREPFAIPAFRAHLVRETADAMELENGVTLAAYPCRPHALRGLRACIVVADELAFFTSTDGRPTDQEMLRVARGRVANTGGKVIILSSPYAQTGALFELHRKHYGVEDSDTLIWQATAKEMNPRLTDDYLERMKHDDPEAYQSEVLGQFRVGTSQLLDPEAITACIDTDVRVRPPQAGIQYSAFVDVSGGRRDRMALAIGHRESDRVIVDAIRSWIPPFNPAGVIAEACQEIKRYGLRSVTGDRYSAEFAAEQFRAGGVDYKPSQKDRSALYLELLPMVNAGQVSLLDNERLVRELRLLERRRGPSGRDKVDHPRGGTDDIANAVAGVVDITSGDRCVVGFTGIKSATSGSRSTHYWG